MKRIALLILLCISSGCVATAPTDGTSRKAESIKTSNIHAASNIGVLAFDARWSEFGPYMQVFLDTVQDQWYKILTESLIAPKRGSQVVVTFKLNSKGETEMMKVEDVGAGKQGVFACQNAITSKQPYRKWTKDMIAALGDEEQITLIFYYQ